jgi:hypothetical protein
VYKDSGVSRLRSETTIRLLGSSIVGLEYVWLEAGGKFPSSKSSPFFMLQRRGASLRDRGCSDDRGQRAFATRPREYSHVTVPPEAT